MRPLQPPARAPFEARDTRILQIAPYLSADGAYGGPVTVALEQARALANRGHQVTVAMGWDGAAQPPAGLDCRLFRARKLAGNSFGTLTSPTLIAWLVRHARHFDVVHVHMARDALTLPAALVARLLGLPVIVQTHGMITVDERRTLRCLDALLTKRVLARAALTLWLTPQEREQLSALGAPRLAHLANAVDLDLPRAEYRSPARVVYASRLAPRKRPTTFVEAAALVLRKRQDITFELWGPDEGEVGRVERLIAELGIRDRCRYEGALSGEDIRHKLLPAVQVFVLPSLAEPFPMAVLEAFAVGLPVVMTSDTGISARASETGAARVVTAEASEMADAIISLASSPDDWNATSEAALRLARTDYSPMSLAERLSAHYAGALSKE
jgi:glycosyltransferase involved in cell wall biosynthesis